MRHEQMVQEQSDFQEAVERLEQENRQLVNRYENLVNQFQLLVKQDSAQKKRKLDESKDSAGPVSTHTTGMSPGKEKLYKDLV